MKDPRDSAAELVRLALEHDSRARAVASMHCDGNAAGLCATAELAEALEVYDHAIAVLRAARAHLATLEAQHEKCGRCPWGAPCRS